MYEYTVLCIWSLLTDVFIVLMFKVNNMYVYFCPVNHCIFCLLFTWWCNHDSLFFQERVGCVHCCKFPSWQQLNHRNIRLMEGNEKCRHQNNWPVKELCGICVSEFIANIFSTLSHVGIFNPALGSVLSCVAPIPFSLVQLSPLPCVNKYIECLLYTYTVCKGEGVGFLSLQTDKHLPQSPFKGNFFRWRHFAFVSI